MGDLTEVGRNLQRLAENFEDKADNKRQGKKRREIQVGIFSNWENGTPHENSEVLRKNYFSKTFYFEFSLDTITFHK